MTTSSLEDKINELTEYVDALDNDPVMQLVHENYLAMLEQAKAQRKARRWFVCDEERK
jgi:hypothetical protein